MGSPAITKMGLPRSQGARCEDGRDDIDPETNQLLRQLWKSIGLCVRRTQFECIILPFDEPKLA